MFKIYLLLGLQFTFAIFFGYYLGSVYGRGVKK